MSRNFFSRNVLPAVLAILTSQISQAQVNVLTYHNDNARTGANTNETILTPGNVNTNSFGKLFTYTVDGYVYTQPLYVANLAIAGKGIHNTVFVATEGDTVYAFDADTNLPPLWQVNLLGAGETTLGTNDVHTTDVTPQIGITGTPVIDAATGTLYLIAKSKLISGGATNYIQRLHALDITTGNERSNGPVLIQATVPGTGVGTDGTQVAFNPLSHHQRSGLLLLNGVLYIDWAAHGDIPPYHGWVMAYDAQTLQQLGAFNATPNGSAGGIWHAGGGPAADSGGNVYVMTGNGTFDGSTNNDYGDSFIRLTGTNLTLADYFTPYNQATLSVNDTDVGSGGPLILPDSVGSSNHLHLVVGAGKQGTIYLVDRDNMGAYHAANDNQIVQHITNGVGVNLSTPAYFNNRVYFMAYKDYVKAFSITNGVLSTTPISQSTLLAGIFGATISISASGTNHAIAWIVLVDAFKSGGPAVLHAYDAYNLKTELYNSSQAGTRDQPGGAVKFTVPTVANGKVYFGTQTTLAVYGNAIFTNIPIFIAQPQSQTIPVGSNVVFSAGVLSSNAFQCQWFFDGHAIPGATATNYSITNVQLGNAGNYAVAVSNSVGSLTSSLAFLSVLVPLTNAPGAVLAPPGLVDWWPADGNAIDIYGGYNGIPQNGFSYAPGESGSAFNFDGVASSLSVSAPNIPPPWTASLWVKRSDTTNTAAIIIADGNYSLKLEQYNKTHKVGITALNSADWAFNYIMPTNTWVHLAFVGVSTGVTLYANGVSEGTITTNNFPLPRTYIGAGFATSRYIDYMLGSLDEILLFNRALSVAEVNSIYSAGSAGLIRAPRISSVVLSNSQLILNLLGQTGKTFTILSSTNLTTWTPLTTLANPNGTNSYVDLMATNGAQKFYRVSQP